MDTTALGSMVEAYALGKVSLEVASHTLKITPESFRHLYEAMACAIIAEIEPEMTRINEGESVDSLFGGSGLVAASFDSMRDELFAKVAAKFDTTPEVTRALYDEQFEGDVFAAYAMKMS